jgi:hypothetical protein
MIDCKGYIAKESIIEKTYCCENLPRPLFAKEGNSSLLESLLAPALGLLIVRGRGR